MRRATFSYFLYSTEDQHFYPRSPCGERRYAMERVWRRRGISTHALHAESDRNARLIASASLISTHALHAESDAFVDTIVRRYINFYPRSPCGERRLPGGGGDGSSKTISTHALHAESDRIPRFVIFDKRFISTHALHAESDSKRQQKHIQNLQPICKNAKSLRFMPAYLTSHSL